MALLAIIGIAFGLMLGLLKPGAAMSRLGRIFAGLIFFPVGLVIARGAWAALPLMSKGLLLFVGIPILAGLAVRFVFGEGVYSEFMGHLLYDAFRWLVRCTSALLLACSCGVSLLATDLGAFVQSRRTSYRILNRKD